MDFTTSVFWDSTCRSETGSTASASPCRASPWSLCKDQIYCAENTNGPASGDRKSDVRYKGQNSLELLDPGQHGLVFVVAQMHVVSMGMPGVEGMVTNHVQALRNSREREMWRLTLRFCFRLHFPASYLPLLGWDSCWTSSLCRGILQTTARRSGTAEKSKRWKTQLIWPCEDGRTIMAPGHEDFLHPTVWCVHPIFSA